LKKNDLVTLTITDISTEGNGVGRHDGMAVFVPFAAVSDTLSVRIVKVGLRHAYGIAEAILSPGPSRIAADCAVFGRCGGCALRHIDYAAECEIKAGSVREKLRRIGGLEAPVLPIIPSPQVDRTRNKAIYPFTRQDGRAAVGFYQKRSHRVVGNSDCKLEPGVFAAIGAAVCDFITEQKLPLYDEAHHTGLVRNLFLRQGDGGAILLGLVLNGGGFPREAEFCRHITARFPEIISIVLSENRDRTNVVLGRRSRVIFGDGLLTDTLCGVRLASGMLSFVQVNRGATELLYQKAAAFAALTGRETVLDLYCGVGAIGLVLARDAGAVIGVEIGPEAVELARQNARNNGIQNARFVAGDAALVAESLAREGLRPDVVILDPPRKGLAAGLIGTVADMAPHRFVMVSCDSATAARDARLLCDRGYTLQQVQPVDMFPRTAHVESVWLFTRGDS